MEGDEKYKTLREAWERATEAMIQAMPSDYDRLTRALRDAHQSFREAIAQRFTPAINKKVFDMHDHLYRNKKSIALWVNEEIAQFGLAIVCPTSKSHSILVVKQDNRHRDGRFSFQHAYADPEKPNERARTGDFVVVPPLMLVPTNIEANGWNRWEDVVKRRDARDRLR